MNLINTSLFSGIAENGEKTSLCYISAGLDDYEEYEKSASGGISKKDMRKRKQNLFKNI